MRKPYARRSAAAKFWKLVKPGPECWVWAGALSTSGYPVWSQSAEAPQVAGAKFAFWLKHGRYPQTILGRTCGNKLCVRADHLFERIKVVIEKPKKTWTDSFFEKVGSPDENGCWPFIGCLSPNGYGRFRRDNAHRIAWTIYNGPVPDGKWILHHCDNPSCVNPSHLYAGTPKDNAQDRMKRGRHRYGTPVSDDEIAEILRSKEPTYVIAKRMGRVYRTVLGIRRTPERQRRQRATATHCRNGHLRTHANTHQDSRGSIACRECNAAAVARYRARKTAAVE